MVHAHALDSWTRDADRHAQPPHALRRPALGPPRVLGGAARLLFEGGHDGGGDVLRRELRPVVERRLARIGVHSAEYMHGAGNDAWHGTAESSAEARFVWTLADERLIINGETRFIILTGFMGSFTTFSTFAFETSGLLRDAEWWSAAGNVLGHNLLGVAGVIGGMALGKFL